MMRVQTIAAGIIELAAIRVTSSAPSLSSPQLHTRTQ
jgi:hypothetical protein